MKDDDYTLSPYAIGKYITDTEGNSVKVKDVFERDGKNMVELDREDGSKTWFTEVAEIHKTEQDS